VQGKSVDLRGRRTLQNKDPNPIGDVLAWMPVFQLFGENVWATLVKVRAQSYDFVSQNSVVFGKRVSGNDRVKHAKAAGEQERCRHREKQNKLYGDGAAFSAI